MKALYFLIPLLMANACKTTQTNGTAVSSDIKSMEQAESSMDGCPEEGTCTVKIHKNKKLNVKQDGIGASYPEIVDGNNIVIEYTYLKKGPAGTADGDYSETIHFEIPATASNISKEDKALADVNLLYGRHCFCRDGGYFPITDGKLLVKKNNQAIMFDLTFKTDKTTQVVSHISETVKM